MNLLIKQLWGARTHSLIWGSSVLCAHRDRYSTDCSENSPQTFLNPPPWSLSYITPFSLFPIPDLLQQFIEGQKKLLSHWWAPYKPYLESQPQSDRLRRQRLPFPLATTKKTSLRKRRFQRSLISVIVELCTSLNPAAASLELHYTDT